MKMRNIRFLHKHYLQHQHTYLGHATLDHFTTLTPESKQTAPTNHQERVEVPYCCHQEHKQERRGHTLPPPSSRS